MPATLSTDTPGGGWKALDESADEAVPKVAEELFEPASSPATAPGGRSKSHPKA